MIDLHNNINVAQALAPAAVTDNTAQVCTVINNANYDSVEYIINIGTLADADATFTVLLEDSADNVTYAAVADDFLLGTEAAASFQFDDDNEVRRLGYNGSKQYTRMTITPANNTGSAVFGVTAIQYAAIHNPVANN